MSDIEKARKAWELDRDSDDDRLLTICRAEEYIALLEAKLAADAKYAELGRRVMEMKHSHILQRGRETFWIWQDGTMMGDDSDPNAALIAAGVLLPEEKSISYQDIEDHAAFELRNVGKS